MDDAHVEVLAGSPAAVEVAGDQFSIEINSNPGDVVEVSAEPDLALSLTPEGETLLEVRSSATEAVEIDLGERGPIGQVGPEGPRGPAGNDGRDGVDAGSYVHHQQVASDVWVIEHNLNFFPAGITIKNSAGDIIYGATIVQVSASVLMLSFSAAFAGRVYLS